MKTQILKPYANEINTLGEEFNRLIEIKGESDIKLYKQKLVTSFEHFLIDIYKVFQGIDAFLKSRVIHFDIKFNNIVTLVCKVCCDCNTRSWITCIIT